MDSDGSVLQRSIPARAGEPAQDFPDTPALKVHPRACGGALLARPRLAHVRGPSPRVRGSPPQTDQVAHGDRSIPARAGEPRRHATPPACTGVHPRACGGALSDRVRSLRPAGPSPRVRGSLGLLRGLALLEGSIPARAGEPRRSSAQPRNRRVHPRACGGASARAPRPCGSNGPSPRVRGSHQLRPLHVLNARSIPARAGEPESAFARALSSGVHPRACGGAFKQPVVVFRRQGPSPRVRGSPCSPDSSPNQ